MSVVIKMDMPKDCRHCWNHFVCNNYVKYGKIGQRPENCPIFCELPEKHGRLIDADAIDWWKGEDAEGNPVFILNKVDINKEPTIVEAEG